MTGSSNILVLVADEKSATLCANTDGVSRLLRTMHNFPPVNDRIGDGDFTSTDQHVFACELMMALCCDTGKYRYDGLVIFADAAMMQEIRRVQTRTISQLVIAHIVGKPAGATQFLGAVGAAAGIGHEGVLH
jgi:protein required for attachment to host cells